MTPGEAIAGAINRARDSHKRLVQVHQHSLPSTSAKQREQRAKSVADALEYVNALEQARDQVKDLQAIASKFAALLQPEEVYAHQANEPNHQGVFAINRVTITLGDLRCINRAVEALGVL